MRITWVAAALATAVAAFGAAGGARAADEARYVSAGVVVARAAGVTPVDNGAVVCADEEGLGAGGACLSFGGGDAVSVVDDTVGEDVPFQVCLDNNGDGFCTTNDPDPVCPDQLYFSHDDDGSFFNPVGPLPTGFLPGCAGGAWDGYVVFLCEGVHATAAPPDAHVHPVTTGAAGVTSGGEGLGTFCGGPPIVSKPYYAAYSPEDGNLGCGMTAVSQSFATGQNVEGTVVGGPWRADGPVVIRCVVTVNGSEVTSAPAGTGTGAAATTGRVTFSAWDSDAVVLRTEVTTTSGTAVYDVRVPHARSGDTVRWVTPQRVY